MNVANKLNKGWGVAGILTLILLILMPMGNWRSNSVGAQIAVPMFYDAHYLFPRPWTQEQSAPPPPPPTPVSVLYGDNQVRQTFTASAGNLSLLRFWLAGDSPVQIWLHNENGNQVASGNWQLANKAGDFYHVALPAQFAQQQDILTLILSAPTATFQNPVTIQTVGGDWFGSSIHLNEYPLPGNLALTTYASGLPGRWWLNALGEQILPATFQLRLQQYKPAPFKGATFAILLMMTILLSGLFLWLVLPAKWRKTSNLGWLISGCLLLFLSWQLGSKRLLLAGIPRPVQLQVSNPSQMPAIFGDGERLTHDFALTTWTSERAPETRWVEANWRDNHAGIQTPANASILYHLTVPNEARLTAGITPPTVGTVTYTISVADTPISQQTVHAGDAPQSLSLDLTTYATQPTTIRFVTQATGGAEEARWQTPQLFSRHSWLHSQLPDSAIPISPIQFNQSAMLIGYEFPTPLPHAGMLIPITLYWQTDQPTDNYGTVFLHLRDEAGAIVAQHDGQPVGGTYPTALWQVGTIIEDVHWLVANGENAGNPTHLAIGLYNPADFVRWDAQEASGTLLPDNQLIIPLPTNTNTP